MSTSKNLLAVDMDTAHRYVAEEAAFEQFFAKQAGITVEQLHAQREAVPNLATYLDVMLQGWLMAKGVELLNEKSKGPLI